MVMEWTVRVTGLLLFIHELIGQNQDGQRQHDDAAGPRPSVHTAEQEIHGKKTAEEEHQRRNHQANNSCKSSMPDGAQLVHRMSGTPMRHYVATAVLADWAGEPVCSVKQALQTRGRRLRNETAPLARQL